MTLEVNMLTHLLAMYFCISKLWHPKTKSCKSFCIFTILKLISFDLVFNAFVFDLLFVSHNVDYVQYFYYYQHQLYINFFFFGQKWLLTFFKTNTLLWNPRLSLSAGELSDQIKYLDRFFTNLDSLPLPHLLLLPACHACKEVVTLNRFSAESFSCDLPQISSN